MGHVRGIVCAALLSASSSLGCVHSHKTLLDTTPQPPADSIVLEIENHNWSDIDIFIVHDGRTNRLTSVTAAKDVSIEIPPAYQGETGVFTLIVTRIGGRDTYQSPPVSIRTGKTVRLTVESTLARSSVGVW